jgi:hypothetical protein
MLWKINFRKLTFISLKALAIQVFQPSVVKQNPFSYQKQTEIMGDFCVLIVIISFEVVGFVSITFTILYKTDALFVRG